MNFTAAELQAITANLHKLPQHEQAETLALLEEFLDRKNALEAQTSLLAFAHRVAPVLQIETEPKVFMVGPHHRKLATLMDAVARGEKRRILISIGPRFGKSLMSSYLFPAWYLGKFPNRNIIMASHTADLATGFGRKVRDLIDTPEYRTVFPDVALKADSKAAGQWATSAGGQFYAVGVGGALAGRGSELCIIDDPFSERDIIGGNTDVFDDAWTWFQAGPLQRLSPSGACLVIHTRWNKKDLIGRLINQMAKNPDTEQWDVVEFPAILNEDTPNAKSLWPERWPLESLLQKKAVMAPYLWSAQYMQALALNTPIPTPSGWSTMELIQVGDYVIGANGAPVRVEWKSPTYRNSEAYTVTTDDGAEIVADAGHLWAVQLSRADAPTILKTTKQLYDRQEKRRGKPRRRPRIAESAPWALPTACLPIDPYVLGAWLGDGSTGSSQFTAHQDDEAHWRQEFAARGYTLKKYNKDYSYGVGTLRTQLRVAGVLHDKHVPAQYLRASAAQRLELLQGLMDTDGSEQFGRATFANTNTRLVTAVEELALSLGAKPCTTSFMPAQGKRCYKVSVYMPNAFRMARKAKHAREKLNKHGRFVEIRPHAPADTVCIRVANPDGLFLAGRGCLVTHNCPTGEAGALIKREWWKNWEKDEPPDCEYVIITLDAAQESHNRADFNAFQAWGVFYDEREKANIIMLDAWQKRMEYPELKKAMMREYEKWEPDCCLLEKKSSGSVLFQEMRHAGIPVSEFTPGKGQDKIARVNSVSDIFESGLVWAPLDRRWAMEVVEQCSDFPNGDHDDATDAMTLALRRFRTGGFIKLDTDEKDEEPGYQRKRSYY